MQATVNDGLIYKGAVSFQVKVGDRIVNKKLHNSGTMQLKRAFAMFLCGGSVARDALRYLPAKIDLKFKDISTGIWYTLLKRPVPVTNPVYDIDLVSEEQGWYTEYTAVIPFSSLQTSIAVGGVYRLFLECEEKAPDDASNDLAYIDINYSDLLGLQAGVSLIITWRLQLFNSEPSGN